MVRNEEGRKERGRERRKGRKENREGIDNVERETKELFWWGLIYFCFVLLCFVLFFTLPAR